VSVLVDTNVLLRRLEPLHEHHRHAVEPPLGSSRAPSRFV
jgi:hypothetical protein